MQDTDAIQRKRLLPRLPDLRRWFPSRTFLWVSIGVLLCCGAIVAAWFWQRGQLSTILEQYRQLQDSPPLWLEVPMITAKYLVAWAIALALVGGAITWIFPEPTKWSRFATVSILLVLALRYILWRTTTLNLDSSLNAGFSLLLFAMEMFSIGIGSLQFFLLVCTRDRRAEADEKAKAVLSGEFLPSVDVLIPTYNEPAFILRRTVIGCQALDYPRKRVYLLDDTRRPEIRDLAAELGCEYLTRPDNRHAKAGNLNHAIARTDGDLIACFDADFVPTTNFLTRTVGFFQDERVALVQTPQSFYSPDPIARNLGLENILVPDQESFYRQIQPVRDGTESVVCAGTSFVLRRSALERVGGDFVTSSLSEDYFTAVKLSSQGYQLVYLDEKLSAGAAPDDTAALATQRLRWAQGTLQAFFIAENPLTVSGLRPLQRLAHLTGILHWFGSLARVTYLIMPLAYSFLGVVVMRATVEELLFFFLPFYLLNLVVFGWLSHRSRSLVLSEIFDVVLCVPLAIAVIRTLLDPFGKGFKVTPKGTQRDRAQFNWALAWPLLVFFVATAVSLWVNLGNCMMRLSPYGWESQFKGIELGWIWSAYNLAILGVALLVLLDVPKPDAYEWFALRRTVCLTLPGDRPLVRWGSTTSISEVGAIVELTQSLPWVPERSTPVAIAIPEEDILLDCRILSAESSGEFPTVRLAFDNVPLKRQRQLVTMLFCRPGQWRRQSTPGELASLLLLLRSVLLPRALFVKRYAPTATAVSQG